MIIRRASWDRWVALLLSLVLLLNPTTLLAAETITVAVASNALAATKAVVTRFEQQSGYRVRLSSGSTGKLYVQIRHGAPFDLFLAADAARPRRLEDEAQIVGERITYAIGHLVLWSPHHRGDCRRLLEQGKFRRLAIANPTIAPYGVAAQETLQRLGLSSALQGRLVQGENIGQTYHYVTSGNAQLGFVAAAQLVQRDRVEGRGTGCRWEVPQAYHRPLVQQAVWLRRAEARPAARAFFEFLHSPAARQIFRDFGYRLP